MASLRQRLPMFVLALAVVSPCSRAFDAPADGSFLTIIGEVHQPQTYRFAKDVRVNLADLIRQAGGRTTSSAMAHIVRFDHSAAALDLAADVPYRDVPLQHGDVIVICSPQRPNQRLASPANESPEEATPEHAVIVPANGMPTVVRISSRGVAAGRILESLGVVFPRSTKHQRVRVIAGRTVFNEVSEADTLHGGDVLFCHRTADGVSRLPVITPVARAAERMHRATIRRAGFELPPDSPGLNDASNAGVEANSAAFDNLPPESAPVPPLPEWPLVADTINNDPAEQGGSDAATESNQIGDIARTLFDDLREQENADAAGVESVEPPASVLVPPPTDSGLKQPSDGVDAATVSLRSDAITTESAVSNARINAPPIDLSEPDNSWSQPNEIPFYQPSGGIVKLDAGAHKDSTPSVADRLLEFDAAEVASIAALARSSQPGTTTTHPTTQKSDAEAERTASIWGIILMVGLGVGLAMIVSGWRAAYRERVETRTRIRKAARIAPAIAKQSAERTEVPRSPEHRATRGPVVALHAATADNGTRRHREDLRETERPVSAGSVERVPDLHLATPEDTSDDGSIDRPGRDRNSTNPSVRISIAACDDEYGSDKSVEESDHLMSPEVSEESTPFSTIPFAPRHSSEESTNVAGRARGDSGEETADAAIIVSLADRSQYSHLDRGQAVQSPSAPDRDDQAIDTTAASRKSEDVLPLSTPAELHSGSLTDDLERLLSGNLLIRREKAELPSVVRLHGNAAGPRTLRFDPPQTELAGPHFQLADSESRSRSQSLQSSDVRPSAWSQESQANAAGQGGATSARADAESVVSSLTEKEITIGNRDTALDRALRQLNRQGES